MTDLPNRIANNANLLMCSEYTNKHNCTLFLSEQPKWFVKIDTFNVVFDKVVNVMHF